MHIPASENSRLTIKDVAVVALIVAVFYGVAELGRRTNLLEGVLRADGSHGLGYEINNIALAIRQDRGFSDPFGVGTGATAWKAPAVPYAFAGLYWLFDDDRDTVVTAVLMLHLLSAFLTGLMVARIAKQHGKPGIGHMAFTAACVLDFHYLFQHAYDGWLFLLVVNLVWIIGACWKNAASIWKWIGWGWLGGATALVAPMCAVIWGCATVRIFTFELREFGWKQTGVRALTAGLFAAIAVSPWAVRNRIALGAWIPVKSNLLYELWQSQCIGEDGLIDIGMQRQHPFASAGKQRADYVSLGEVGFVRAYGLEARASIATNLSGYAERVRNRFLSATVVYSPNHRDAVQTPLGLAISVLLPVFSFAIVANLVFAKNMDPRCIFLFWSWSCALLPYVLVSYYDRYAAPLMGIKALALLMFVSWLFSRKSVPEESNAGSQA